MSIYFEEIFVFPYHFDGMTMAFSENILWFISKAVQNIRNTKRQEESIIMKDSFLIPADNLRQFGQAIFRKVKVPVQHAKKQRKFW